MDNENNPTVSVDFIDFRRLFNTIVRRWKLIVLLMFIGGLFSGVIFIIKKPVYVAVAKISIDPALLDTKASPTFSLLSDQVLERVANKANIKVEDLPEDLSISSPKTDKQIYFLNVESDDPNLSIELANIWAKESIIWITNKLTRLDAELLKATTDLETANQELSSYLQKSNLNYLTWYDLSVLTGIGGAEGITIGETAQTFANITSAQRDTLTDLCRSKSLAEWNFNRIKREIILNSYLKETRVTILNLAVKAENTSLQRSLLLIPLGILIGFFIALIWIIIEDWWKSDKISHMKVEN